MKLMLSSNLIRKALIAAALGFFATVLALSWQMNSAVDLETPIVIDFKPGSTIRTLAAHLQENQLINNTLALRIWARVTNQTTRLQAGEYVFSSGMSINGLLNNMVSGRSRQYSFTIIEGWMFKQVLSAMKANKQIVHTLKNYTPATAMKALGYPEQHPEGRFFPDTYYFTRGTTDVELLKRSYKHMQELLETEWQNRQPDLPFENAYQALILASIVEKESAVPEERPIIAGVFINRLRKKMRLQTDPTVIYGMGDLYRGDIRFRDLRRDTPYNTYTRFGLTPTPIALPGKGAIRAVMQPADTDYLYFVAYSDGSGRHVFSKTNAEHEKQVDIYQRKRRQKSTKKAGS